MPSNQITDDLVLFRTKSRAELENQLITELRGLSNWDRIDTALNQTGVLDFVMNIVLTAYEVNTSVATQSLYNSFIEYASFEETVLLKAAELGYRVTRPTAPQYLLQYDNIPTIRLRAGDVIGSVGDLDLIYFGESMSIEKGDRVTGYVGRTRRATATTEDSITSIMLAPEELTGIENNLVQVSYQSQVLDRSIFPEDYIVFNRYADFSTSRTSTKLLIADSNASHGYSDILDDNPNAMFDVLYLETSGRMPELALDSADAPGYNILSLESNGFNAESTQSIVDNAPLVYSLLRRAVNEEDIKFLANSFPQINDVSLKPYQSVDGVYEFTAPVLATGSSITIAVNTQNFTIPVSAGLTARQALDLLFNQMRHSTTFKVAKDYSDVSNPKVILTTNSPRFLVSVSSVGINTTQTTQQEATASCISEVRYVTSNTVNDPVPLSSGEFSTINETLDQYLVFGLTLFWRHADKLDVNLKFQITSNLDSETIQSNLDFVLRDFRYKIDIMINSSTIIERLIQRVRFLHPTSSISVQDLSPVDIHVNKDQYSRIVLEIL